MIETSAVVGSSIQVARGPTLKGQRHIHKLNPNPLSVAVAAAPPKAADTITRAAARVEMGVSAGVPFSTRIEQKSVKRKRHAHAISDPVDAKKVGEVIAPNHERASGPVAESGLNEKSPFEVSIPARDFAGNRTSFSAFPRGSADFLAATASSHDVVSGWD